MVQAFVIGAVGLPVFGIIFGYAWWAILLSAVAGGPLMVGVRARNDAFRDVFRGRRSESSEEMTSDSRDEQPPVSRARVSLGTLAIIAGVASAIIVFIIVNR
jgi:hypothetical protein